MKPKRRNSIIIEPIETIDFTDNEALNAVLVIGNGFDKSLNLKTSYLDFIQDETFQKLILDGNKFAKYLLDKKNLNNWIDIELELSTYPLRFLRNEDTFENEFYELTSQLKKYLSGIDLKTIDKKSLAYNLIKDLVKFKTLIVDFNYTESVSKILQSLNYDTKLVQHIKIHGSLKDDNIIFGVDDKSELIPKYIFLKKSVHKNYSAINFSKYISEAETIGFFGHSLGETDHMYFSDYFSKSVIESNKMSGKDISIFHYGDKGRLELHSQLDKLTKKSIAKFKQLNNVEFIDTK